MSSLLAECPEHNLGVLPQEGRNIALTVGCIEGRIEVVD